MDKYLQTNRDKWNSVTPIHAKSEFYGVDKFKQGKCTLQDIERREVGDVSGKSLLHFQCHFGMDTMSWARLDAKVTGVDFSEEAITLAKSLADELNIPADFVCCNIYDSPEHISEKFDIVYTSQGVLIWLPDIKGWMKVITHFLKPGGFLYLWEYHPFACTFDDESKEKYPKIRYPYFHSDEPMRFEGTGSYADPSADFEFVTYEWSHSISDIINALIAAGLRLEFLHEFPYTTYKAWHFLEQRDDGMWHYPGLQKGLPLMFSIKAVKPEY